MKKKKDAPQITNEELTEEEMKEKLIRSCEELYLMNEKFKRIEEKYKSKKEDLTSFILGQAVTNFKDQEIYLEKYNKKLTLVRPKKIECLFKRFKMRLGKSKARQYIRTKYYIKDYPGFVEYMKKIKAKPKKVKRFLEAENEMDFKKLDRSYDLGEIDYNSISDCFKVYDKQPYVKFTDRKEQKLEEGE